MAEKIDKKTLHYLEGLSRVKVDETKLKEEKLLSDLRNILEHFEELQKLNTDTVAPLSYGLEMKTVMRDDGAFGGGIAKHEELLSGFSAREGDFLKIPPVFKQSES